VERRSETPQIRRNVILRFGADVIPFTFIAITERIERISASGCAIGTNTSRMSETGTRRALDDRT